MLLLKHLVPDKGENVGAHIEVVIPKFIESSIQMKVSVCKVVLTEAKL